MVGKGFGKRGLNFGTKAKRKDDKWWNEHVR